MNKSFKIMKKFTEDYDGTKVLAIYVEHLKKQEHYKDRFMLFGENTATYRSHIKKLREEYNCDEYVRTCNELNRAFG